MSATHTWLLLSLDVLQYDEDPGWMNDVTLVYARAGHYDIGFVLRSLLDFQVIRWEEPAASVLPAYDWFNDAADGEILPYLTGEDACVSAANELFRRDLRPGDQWYILVKHGWYHTTNYETGGEEWDGQCDEVHWYLVGRQCDDEKWLKRVVPAMFPDAWQWKRAGAK